MMQHQKIHMWESPHCKPHQALFWQDCVVLIWGGSDEFGINKDTVEWFGNLNRCHFISSQNQGQN